MNVHIDSYIDISIVTSTKKLTPFWFIDFLNLEYHEAMSLAFYVSCSRILSCSVGCRNVARGRHFCGWRRVALKE